MKQKKHRLPKSARPLQIIPLAILLNFCGVFKQIPKELPQPPPEPIYQLDPANNKAYGSKIGTGEAVPPISIDDMDHWECMSPDSKAVYNIYIQEIIDAYNRLKRRIRR